LKDADKAIKTVLENVDIISKKVKKKIGFGKVEVFKDVFKLKMEIDPRDVSIDEKIELIRRYNNIYLNNEKILNTHLNYSETIRDKIFISTEGAEIEEELVTLSISGLITSKDGNILQNVRVGVGGSDGFKRLLDRDDVFENKKKIVIDLLKAEPVKAGVYNVILNNSIAGVFTHEAFGHFSEADIIENHFTLREKMKIGEKLGNDILNIVDDPTIPNQLGFYKYDDEGVKAERVQLMKNGILSGRLHSRRTAYDFGDKPNGHCVAENYNYPPIVRMGTIFIEPGDMKKEELFEKLKDGLYICDAKGGQTAGENFSFGAQYGFIVKNGKIDKMIREINIVGNLFTTLKNIKYIADDLKLGEIGGCGKGQTNIRSCHGAPHILIEGVVIGGI
jgi:TldD protein